MGPAVILYSTSCPTTLKTRTDISTLKHILDAKKVEYEEVRGHTLCWMAVASWELRPYAPPRRPSSLSPLPAPLRRWTSRCSPAAGRRCWPPARAILPFRSSTSMADS